MLRFNLGDIVEIHEGFSLLNFFGDYKKHYKVVKCFFDEVHEVGFIEFYGNDKKYCYPSAAFDLVIDK